MYVIILDVSNSDIRYLNIQLAQLQSQLRLLSSAAGSLSSAIEAMQILPPTVQNQTTTSTSNSGIPSVLGASTSTCTQSANQRQNADLNPLFTSIGGLISTAANTLTQEINNRSTVGSTSTNQTSSPPASDTSSSPPSNSSTSFQSSNMQSINLSSGNINSLLASLGTVMQSGQLPMGGSALEASIQNVITGFIGDQLLPSTTSTVRSNVSSSNQDNANSGDADLSNADLNNDVD
jgi:hypothetical protein